MRNVSDKSCRENQNTFCVQKTFPENRSVYEKMWENMAKQDRPADNTDMRHATTEIRSKKCIVRQFRRCANVIQCTYTTLDSTV